MMRLANEFSAGSLQLIIRTGDIYTEDSDEYAQHSNLQGAGALLIAILPCASPNDRKIALHVLAIDHSGNLPFILYNHPDRMSLNMGKETLDHLHVGFGDPEVSRSMQSKEPLHRAKALFDAKALLGDQLVKALLRLAQ